jgi:aryl-alcohol dehydrogenase-like predicted oxidoreductase
MEPRRLGRTGRTVGAVALSASWRPGAAEGGVRALRHAIERGVDLVLVDPGHERARERLVGEAVRDLRARDRIVVATRVTAAPGGPALAPRAVQRQLEDALRATRLDAIPLALLPWTDRHLQAPWWPETRGALERLVREGKALAWGLEPDAAVAADQPVLGLSEPVLAVVALRHDLLAGPMPAALLDGARRHEAGVVVTGPLHQGLLGGAWHGKTRFAADDPRAARWTPEAIAAGLGRIAPLARLARIETDSLAELALRWCLAPPEVSAVAPAMATPDQVDANLRAADGRALTAALLARVAEAVTP